MTDSKQSLERVLSDAGEVSRRPAPMNLAADFKFRAGAGEPGEIEAGRLAHEVVARFVRDPAGFAKAARLADGPSLLRDYRRGLDERLDALIGAPKKSPDRLATLGADSTPSPPEGDATHDAERGPRMGAVLLVAVASISVAAAVVYTALIKHKPL